MPDITKKILINSVLWNAFEKYSSQGITFIVSIIMARILTPTEYGTIGIISVFIGISSVFINSGIGRALISKQNCIEDDFYTANWINIVISIICYTILFFTAPLIAEFYKMPILISTIRIMSISFIFGAISGVSRTILNKEMRFKQISLATLTTSVFSGIIGVSLAYNGAGIWALVYQTVLSSLFSSIWIICISGFSPRFRFSKKSFWELYSFGGKILSSDIIWAIYNNIYPLIIGKGLNAQSVGYYTRASSYSQLVPTNFSGILESVLFPAFSTLQNEDERLKKLYCKALTISSFFIFTGNFFLIGLSYPLIVNMISYKWLPCVPLLQILCLSTLWSHINSINGRLLMAKGYPGVFLKISTVTQPLTLLIIVISFSFGLRGLAWGAVIASTVGTLYNCHVFKTKIGLNPFIYLKKSFKILILAASIGIITLLIFKFYLSPSLTNLILVAVLMTLTYLILIRLLMPGIFSELKNIKRP